jgi:DNA-binding transcriptional MocR family regulator
MLIITRIARPHILSPIISSPIAHFHTTTAMSSSQPKQQHKSEKLINLIRGWPSPSLLPNQSLLAAASTALTDPAIFVPALQYGPDPGYQPLRERIAAWLAPAYGVQPEAERICVTGGASQGLACVLQSFTDPGYTRAVWVVAPMYFLAGPIFEDSGFYGRDGRLRGFGEDGEGGDVRGES